MNTLEFFQAILPPSGVYYLGLIRAGHTGVAHIPFESLELMAGGVAKFDRDPNVTVYHACGAYKQNSVVGADGKRKFRVPENTYAAKALWIDLDCGEEKAAKGQGYPTKSDAVVAVKDFCSATGFPTPLIVDSGNGLHAYWPFTTPLAAHEWKVLAGTFKSVLRHFGVIADPTATADFARILRPIGAHNKKDPDNWKVVKARTPVKFSDPMAIMAALSNIVANNAVEVDELPRANAAVDDDLNDDLTAHAYPNLPTSAEQIAEKCQQVRLMRDTKGDIGYEHWRGVIGIISFCEEGIDLAREWSSERAATGHAQCDVDQKFNTWGSAPTTCAFFGKHNTSGCHGCPHNGKITSPIVLGRIETGEQEVAPLEAVVDEKPVEVEVPNITKGYQWDNNTLWRKLKDKDGNLQAYPISNLFFYPTTRISTQDGTFKLRVRAHMPDKTLRDFDIPTYVVAVGGAQLVTELGHYEVAPVTTKDSVMHLTAYMRDSLHRLLEHSKEMNTMTSFGWKNDMEGFLLGDRLYHKDGTVRRVILGGVAANYAKTFMEPRGTAAGWSEGVNFLYNHDYTRHMQYALCSGFGSILTPLGEELYHGIPVALTSAGSGKGKTTVAMAALSAFGSAAAMLINGKDGGTVNARGARMSAFNNIPILFDEFTNAKAADLSALLYAASNGKDKERMVGGKNGVEMAETLTWDMSSYITANSSIAAILSTGQANTEAEGMRFIEIKTDDYPLPHGVDPLDGMLVKVAVDKTARNAGSAGATFIQYVVSNLNAVETLFMDIAKTVGEAAFTDARYRYYRNHAICTLTAAKVMIDLGLVEFDFDALMDWTMKHIAHQCNEIAENNTVTGEEALNRMINDFAPLIITTTTCKDGRNGGQVEIGHKMSKPAVGRYISGNSANTEPLAGRLYLSKKDMKEWCMKNRVAPSMILDYATSEGILVHDKSDQFNIGRGTDNTTGILRCYIFDYHRLQDAVAGVPLLKVVPSAGNPSGVAA